MKSYKIQMIAAAAALLLGSASCENQDITFDDYEGGTTVYFAYQYPVRTIVLGEDENYETVDDNNHQCKIYATMGGVYSNGKRISVDVQVDNTLCDNLFYADGTPVKAMPSNYYTLGGNQIVLDHSLQGYVDVQLTDAFFADPDALKNTYVIPLVMSNVQGADRILTGTPLIEGDTPARTYSSMWNVQPKDYVLYCLKYVNPWDSEYLRRGIDRITIGGATTTNVRHEKYVEDDEVCSVYTAALNQCTFPVRLVLDGGVALDCELLLTFNDNNECTITANTDGCTATGTGHFKKDADNWADKERDALYLDYNINFGNGTTVATLDTLVVQTRGIASEQFIPTYNAN